jgi:hypothetical protein
MNNTPTNYPECTESSIPFNVLSHDGKRKYEGHLCAEVQGTVCKFAKDVENVIICFDDRSGLTITPVE